MTTEARRCPGHRCPGHCQGREVPPHLQVETPGLDASLAQASRGHFAAALGDPCWSTH